MPSTTRVPNVMMKNKCTLITISLCFVSLCFISQSLDEVINIESYQYSGDVKPIIPKATDLWELEQNRRRSIMRASCGNDTEPQRTKRLYDLLDKRRGFANLMVDDIHKAIYCYIPKAGCTNWKRIWWMLRGEGDVSHKSHDGIHGYTGRMKLVTKEATTMELMNKIETYTKVIVVRNPLERLISAYLNKIHHNENYTYEEVKKFKLPFQKQVLGYVKKLRANATASDITWTEFMDFVAHLRSGYNEHWAPYQNLCHPCNILYDVIAKFESLEEDAERFLRLIQAPEGLHFPYKKKRVSSLVTEPFIKNITPKALEGLLYQFGNDFKMFGYELPKFK